MTIGVVNVVTDGTSVVRYAGNNIESILGGSGGVTFGFADKHHEERHADRRRNDYRLQGVVSGIEFDDVDNLNVGTATDDSLIGMNADAT